MHVRYIYTTWRMDFDMESIKIEHVHRIFGQKKRRLDDAMSSCSDGNNLTFLANASVLKGPRKKNCEDNCKVTLDLGLNISCCSGISFCAVIDGHGGQMAVDWIHQNLENIFCRCINRNLKNWRLSSLDSVDDERAKSIIISSMYSAFAHAENIVCKKEDESGVCLLVCIIFRNYLMCFNSGDCGAVFQRMSGESEPLNILHCAECPGEDYWVTSCGSCFVNGRIGGSLEPTRSLGDIDVKSLLPGVVSHTPDLYITNLSSCSISSKGEKEDCPHSTDMIVMCTDGVHGPYLGMDNVVKEAREWEFLAHLNVDPSLGSTSQKLTSSALGERKRGADDASAIVVFIRRDIAHDEPDSRESENDHLPLKHK